MSYSGHWFVVNIFDAVSQRTLQFTERTPVKLKFIGLYVLAVRVCAYLFGGKFVSNIISLQYDATHIASITVLFVVVYRSKLKRTRAAEPGLSLHQTEMPAVTKSGSRPSSSKIDVSQRPVYINSVQLSTSDDHATVTDDSQHRDGTVSL